jgi:hypothetical protein
MPATMIRDHGVFNTQPPAATVEAMKLNCDRLVAEKAELDHRLSPLLDKIQAGSATAEESALVVELAEDSRILTDRLHHANVELKVIEEKQARQQSATARARFNFLVAEDRQKRAKFARLYREASVTLGELCANVDEATTLANSFAALNVAGLNPVDRNSIAQMSERIDPLPELLDSGLTPTTEFGWNFRISVVPLKGSMK